MTRLSRSIAAIGLLAAAPLSDIRAQQRGAIALGEAVAGLDVTARVLIIGAHPDDEDTQLISWLARGRHVETGYLSLTRGDGGQNLIGNELGPLLGMIRTEELMAARRLDGGRQFFTRAFDFGFSKSAAETYAHWPKDSILKDVVTIVRAFRPHVIVAVFSGTPRDGHGHHQVSAILAREAFDAAADTVRFPASQIGFGAWEPSKFYRAARFSPQEATLAFNVGELSALRGRSYAEIASESRSQHLSQGFGVLQRRGTSMDYLKLEVSRLGKVVGEEHSPLDGVDASWSRFAATTLRAPGRAALDSLPSSIADVRRNERLDAPAQMVAPLARVVRLLGIARGAIRCGNSRVTELARGCDSATGDLVVAIETTLRRAHSALLAASGVLIEATAPRELLAARDTLPVTVTVYNQGTGEVALDSALAETTSKAGHSTGFGTVASDSALRVIVPLTGTGASVPWWLITGRFGDTFVMSDAVKGNLVIGEDRIADTRARAWLRIAGVAFEDVVPIIYRFADPAKGERGRPVTVVPAITVLLDEEVEYARADVAFDRTYTVHLRSATKTARGVIVELSLPDGLHTDTLKRRASLEPFGASTLSFRVRGTLRAGRHLISARATSEGEIYDVGYVPILYDHIRPLRYYRTASVQLEAVTATLPSNPKIAYIPGVGDNVERALMQLGLVVTTITSEQLATADLSNYGAIVVGPRAFAASSALVASAGRLQQFARIGGTVVVQYGQAEIQIPGILPYPVSLARPAERVTDEHAPVTVVDPTSRLLLSPNRIVASDYENWVQERAVYLPSTFDPHYQTLFEIHDPGEKANMASVLVASIGKGAYVYTTLALFRQLPAGIPGPARLFLNLLAAKSQPVTSTRVSP